MSDAARAPGEAQAAEEVEVASTPASSPESLAEFLPADEPLKLPPAGQVRSARVASLKGRRAQILIRGLREPVEALLAPEVEPEVVDEAREGGQSVLVEITDGEVPLVIGVIATRRPREIKLRAATVTIEGEREVLLRSGRAAVRIREDGDIEVVGSRISAASRGLFRIVGRMLRLN